MDENLISLEDIQKNNTLLYQLQSKYPNETCFFNETVSPLLPMRY